ncbi:hypothetical protein [Haloimpatiens massiliensis]|uniref:hypothetical protein n=1 Tax=Haloimpatiens massiliensis TaxID=1658110 RepID=UPI000C856FD5|nr:hypothetical protein [Haloimpatiens massiliensis]
MYNCYWPCMPYMNMYDDHEDLRRMYPRIYHKIYPMVIMHCDMMERKYGWMYTPSDKDLDEACENMYENIKDHLEEMDEEYEHNDHKDYNRKRHYGRRRALNDLFRILLIRELIGRRRRRRRPHYGHGGYWY